MLDAGIWHVSREYAGVAEAGGLKDAVAGLAAAQARRGLPVAVILPRYGFLDLERLGAHKLDLSFRLRLPAGNEASACAPELVEVHRLRREGVEIFLLETARTRAKRDVYTHTAADELDNPYQKKGTGHWDAHHLNLTLQRGALELARRARLLGWNTPPALFHCHDGHAGFLPALLRLLPAYRHRLEWSRALLTLHNAGSGYHQEIYGLRFAAQLTGLPVRVLAEGLVGGVEAVDPLLLGPRFAAVSTVSEQYAAEIASGELEKFTGGLGAAYRAAGVRLRGITNGIDPAPYDPRRPENTGLAYAFDPGAGDWEGKRGCRRWLAAQLALAVPAGPAQPGYLQGREPDGARFLPSDSPLAGLRCYGTWQGAMDTPLFVFVGRLAGQKGVDLLAAAAAQLLSRRAGIQFLVLGQGERAIEERLAEIALSPAGAGRFCLLVGFDSLAARYCFAAGDFFLVPSLYEPCGLTDLYAQMMGSLPIVHRVGGLVKVRHGETGFSYASHTVEALSRAIQEAADEHRQRPEALERMRRQAFREVYEHHTWDRVLEEGYLPLYSEVLDSP